MSRKGLFLLLAVIVFAAMSCAAQTVRPAAPSPMVAAVENPPSLDTSSSTQSFQLSPSERSGNSDNTTSDGICYKIRAFIFRRDDDHAPEFVRSTTCPPVKPRTKDIAWPKARLVPAK